MESKSNQAAGVRTFKIVGKETPSQDILKAQEEKDGPIIIVKRFEKIQEGNLKTDVHYAKEISTFEFIAKDNQIPKDLKIFLLGQYTDNYQKTNLIFMEFQNQGDLQKINQLIDSQDYDKQFNQVLIDSCQVLKRMHRNGICHGDIKSNNIFVHLQGQEIKYKVSDFNVVKNVFQGSMIETTYTNQDMCDPTYRIDKVISCDNDLYQLVATLFYVVEGKILGEVVPHSDYLKIDDQLIRGWQQKEYPRLFQHLFGHTVTPKSERTWSAASILDDAQYTLSCNKCHAYQFLPYQQNMCACQRPKPFTKQDFEKIQSFQNCGCCKNIRQLHFKMYYVQCCKIWVCLKCYHQSGKYYRKDYLKLCSCNQQVHQLQYDTSMQLINLIRYAIDQLQKNSVWEYGQELEEMMAAVSMNNDLQILKNIEAELRQNYFEKSYIIEDLKKKYGC